ncbi:hypothetical protein BDV29DRAFT_168998 [Aspergillus leporis]|jgi:hypothetical protein|uniref:Secreted protein n=1 Tax=Aspergillus leporis TaxID=41062 RepID=A0A5N5XAA3_9EURO|nr:hypothetical protein BDV29DRAFT_168998 [Aspergillus leporis]
MSNNSSLAVLLLLATRATEIVISLIAAFHSHLSQDFLFEAACIIRFKTFDHRHVHLHMLHTDPCVGLAHLSEGGHTWQNPYGVVLKDLRTEQPAPPNANTDMANTGANMQIT